MVPSLHLPRLGLITKLYVFFLYLKRNSAIASAESLVFCTLMLRRQGTRGSFHNSIHIHKKKKKRKNTSVVNMTYENCRKRAGQFSECGKRVKIPRMRSHFFLLLGIIVLRNLELISQTENDLKSCRGHLFYCIQFLIFHH